MTGRQYMCEKETGTKTDLDRLRLIWKKIKKKTSKRKTHISKDTNKKPP